jgi:two-component system sensor kinase FixL
VLGEISATLAHELNQPLTAILSNAQAGQRLLGRGTADVDELREILVDIVADTQRAGAVIRRLRDLLRKGSTESTQIDLAEVVQIAGKTVNAAAHLRRVSVRYEIAPDLPTLQGNSTELTQVFLNLMLNAIDAMHDAAREEQTLVVHARLAEGPCVVVQVRDSGTGVPPEDLERIFDPFVSSKRDGMGMGLPICRSIIERHRGRLWATNNPDRGATFHFTLPVPGGAA